MDWEEQAKLLFDVPKPAHFVDYTHCCECAEHDETLLAYDVDSTGMDQLGHPSWDPLCFSDAEGLKYYLPAMIRLTLATIAGPQESYLDQMLFHLLQDGPGNRLVSSCNQEQRRFIADFLEHLMNNYTREIDDGVFAADDILKAHGIWCAGNHGFSPPTCDGGA